MKKPLSLMLFLLFFFRLLSYGQFNTNTPIDSNKHNNPVTMPFPPNPIVPKIDSAINKSLLDGGLPVQPNPFITPKDTANVYDSLHGKLTVYIKNINKITGNINIAVFNSYASFANNGPVFRGAVIPVTANMMMVPFDSVPKGIYSVAVFHDEDKNGVLNKNQMNIPLEGYGFSNNAAANLGPPNYAQTKFIYSGKNKSITIFMTYFKFPK